MAVVVMVAYAVICAVLAAWMVIAASLAGTLMRMAHFEIARTRSFAIIRRYGIKDGSWRLLRRLVRHPSQLISKRGRHALAIVVLVPLMCFMSAAFLPYALGLLLPVDHLSKEIRHASGLATWLPGILSAIVGTYAWLRGLGYIARPQDQRRGRLPRLKLPTELSIRGRDRLAVNVFWREQIRTAEFFAAIYPLFILVTIASSLSPANTQPTMKATTPPLLGLAVAFLFLSPSIVPAIVVGSRVQRRFAASHAVVVVSNLLFPKTPSEEDDQIEFPEIIPESTGERRGDLAHTSDLLSEAAERLDAQQPRGFSPHPTATLLRGVAETIRQFLRSPHAYDSTLPPDLQEVLRLTLVVLSGPRNARAYQLLASRVSAFDEDGNPSVQLFVKPPGRLAVLYGRATTSATRMAALIAALASIVVPLVAAALVLIGKIDAERFLDVLK